MYGSYVWFVYSIVYSISRFLMSGSFLYRVFISIVYSISHFLMSESSFPLIRFYYCRVFISIVYVYKFFYKYT